MTLRRLPPVVVALLVGLAACGAKGSSGTSASRPSASPAPPPAREAATARLGLRRVGSFDTPVYVTSPPGDTRRLFVVEQKGVVRVIRDGRVLRTPFLNIRRRVTCCGEQGLLSLAFAPDYARTGRFYVYYTDRGGSERIEGFRRASADRANPGTRRLVLRMGDPEPNHNGGLMIFGPDRHMYVGTGDGGGANDQHGARGNAQNRNSLLGKLLRIDPAPFRGRPYRVPSDNPFVGRDGRDEIWSYGLRNPWRWSFDRQTGDLIIGDVGQNNIEEVDFAPGTSSRGANFGWRPWEGRRRNFDEPAPNPVFPEITYPTSSGCAVTGGYVVRDRRLTGWGGRYLYGDFCNGVVQSVVLSDGRATGRRATGLHVDQLSSFGEDALGRIYAVSLGGRVYRIVAR